MKSVRVEDAVGMILAHDLTKIVPGVFKGAAFKKGHVIRQEDIEALKDAGKYNVFVIPFDDGQVHESEAAKRIAEAASAEGLVLSEPSEGKVNIRAPGRGLLKIDKQALYEVNSLGSIALVSLHDNTVVEKDRIVAAAKIIPLAMEDETVGRAEKILLGRRPVIDVRPFRPLRTGIVVTGSEVYYGRIQDKFGKILAEKVRFYGGVPLETRLAPDDADFIGRLIKEFLDQGAEAVLVSGGMAVDADDVTPVAIRNCATEVVTYGVPILPGSMAMVAYSGEVPIMGVPACAMFHGTTVLDLLYPRLLAMDRVKREDMASMAHGGLCLNCETCKYPVCPFGK